MGQILIDMFKTAEPNNTANASKEKFNGNKGRHKYKGNDC